MHELPAGLQLHYDPHLIFRCWRRWVMTGRQSFPDVRQVLLEDEAYDNDMWVFDLLVRYVVDSQNETGQP